MGQLLNAAKFATDNTAGGFRDMALTALVNQARQVVAAGAAQTGLDYARAVLRTPVDYRDTASWVAATDPQVAVLTAPDETKINQAIVTAWPYLVVIGSNP